MKNVVIPVMAGDLTDTVLDVSPYVEGEIRALKAVRVYVGGTSPAVTEKTIVTDAPASGQVQLSDKKELTFYTGEIAANNIVVAEVEYFEEFARV